MNKVYNKFLLLYGHTITVKIRAADKSNILDVSSWRMFGIQAMIWKPGRNLDGLVSHMTLNTIG